MRSRKEKLSRAATLLEAMMLLTVISIVLLGTGVAYQTLVRVPTANNQALMVSYLLMDKMERLRALDFPTLSATASGSDTATMDGVTYARSWTITSNPGGAYNANFLQITVAIGNQSFVSGVCKP